jgi:cell wall assembly regulator SMI1
MMNQAEQTAFIKNGMERLYQELEQTDPICLRMCDVPEAMRASPVSEDGWCKWRLVPSSVTAEDLDRLERQTGCGFPFLLRTFLSTYFHYFDDMGLGRQTMDEPFDSMENAWNPTLVRAGYLPFLWDEKGYFIRCIDLANMPDEDRCPVVEIDHEILFDFDEDAGREEIQPAMEPVAASLRAFLEPVFLSGWFVSKSRKLAQDYINGLQEAYKDNDSAEIWDDFTRIAHGAGADDLARLRMVYPELPASLETLLKFADGTYYREYQPGRKTCLYFLGSDMEEYPYYLLSAGQMLQTKDRFSEWGKYLIEREYDGIPVDERITNDRKTLRWLHFSDCMNNGGTSQLYIDFSPSETGRAGQIVRYVHDPDELTVIADSFDEYLQMLMDNEYDFINEDTVDE